MDTPVEFPEAPEFQRRYLVSSPDPEGARRFLSGEVLQQLAQTRLYSIYAGGQIFTFSQLNPSKKAFTLDTLSERMHMAAEVYQIFQG